MQITKVEINWYSLTSERPVKDQVKLAYTVLAEQGCCGPAEGSKLASRGYTPDELGGLPESVLAMSDGCGNPTALGTMRGTTLF